MNQVYNHGGLTYVGYHYPVLIPNSSDTPPHPGESQRKYNENHSNSTYYFNQHPYDIDLGPGLYDAGKKLVPHPMQMIGSLIDVYA